MSEMGIFRQLQSCVGARLTRRHSASGGKMKKRLIQSAGMACVLFSIFLVSAGAQLANQKTTVNQSDIVLFQRAQKALKQANYTDGRNLLQTLLNTYPDSDYVPQAKLGIADSWYAQHAFKLAKLEYQDFVTFFPNRPEVAEAQRRINSIEKDSR